MKRRRSEETYSRSVKDMVIDSMHEFEAWFENINKEFSPTRSGGKIKLSVEAVEAGLVDFKTLDAETRRKMGASYTDRQSSGKNRAGTRKAAPKKAKK